MTGQGETIAELAKRRGFFFQSASVYGGVAGFYTYGPHGSALKANVEAAWRDRFVHREGHMELDAPDIMPEAVFEASGHLDGFDDMIVECPECGASHRADHLVEDVTGLEDVESRSVEEVTGLVANHDILCPACGTDLAGEPVEQFNLMFETNIGPGTSSPGYLRPETAQGIFVEFPQLEQYARGQLPFGVAQIGTAYRNEISPRKSLVRVREFTQAELEHFVHPEEDDPPLERVAGVELPLYAASDQLADGEDEDRESNASDDAADGSDAATAEIEAAAAGERTLTVREAVESGVIANEWIAFYMGLSKQWFERVGVDMDRFRYRQHLAGELAHYASDCWDAEAELDGDWVELTGFGDRGSYDLDKHAEHSGEEFTVFEQYDEPRTVERATVDPEMSYLGPEFGGAAGEVADALADLVERDPEAFDGEAVTVTVDGTDYTVPTEQTGFGFETVTESGEHVTPQVIEPSFGVGRLVYTVVAHAYREDVVDGEERSSLALPPAIAPTTVAVFPLMDKDGLGDRAREVEADLREAGLAVDYDDSGAIGRRYRRQDEVGTPYCVTVDYETLEDDTVTVRERDSTAERRVAVDDLAATLAALRDGHRSFDEV